MEETTAIMMGVTLSTLFWAGLIGWIVWLYSRRRQEKVRAQLEIQRRMLDKFSTAGELTTFIASEGGQEFMDSLTTEKEAHTDRIMTSIRRGSILTILGFGLYVLMVWVDPSDRQATAIMATIAATVGIGYLVSAAVSYRLSKSWDLIPPTTR